MWPVSPFGAIADVMVETADGHRVLVAPSAEAGDFIAATYTFDEIRIEPTRLRAAENRWAVTSESVRVAFSTGRRSVLGEVLASMPRHISRNRWWCAAIDRPARMIRPGVRTYGTAGGGRREWYAALDEHVITAAAASWLGSDLGALCPVDPPVRFGFGSAPSRPSLVRITTTVRLAAG